MASFAICWAVRGVVDEFGRYINVRCGEPIEMPEARARARVAELNEKWPELEHWCEVKIQEVESVMRHEQS